MSRRIYRFILDIEVTEEHKDGDFLIDAESTEQHIERCCETVQSANITFVELVNQQPEGQE